jgi:hypothetical protein
MVFPYLKGLIVIKRDFAYCSSISVVVLLYLVLWYLIVYLKAFWDISM